MTDAPGEEEIESWLGLKVVGDDGAKLGTIEHVFVSNATDKPAFALVRAGLFGSKSTLVPIGRARLRDGHVHVGFTKQQVREAPDVEDPSELSVTDARKLFSHYGVAIRR